MRQRNQAVLVCSLASTTLLACDATAGSDNLRTGVAFDVTFVIDSVTLEEAPDDLIGDAGAFDETTDGGFLIADAIEPRVRRYSSDGSLQGSFGKSGEGPFEFRQIGGIVELASSAVLVIDPGLARVTLLSSRLERDTSFVLSPRPQGPTKRLGDGHVLLTSPGNRTTEIMRLNAGWQRDWSIPAPTPGSMFEYPYWDSFATTPIATARDQLAATYSLRYPIYIYDGSGRLQDSITTAPKSFRPAPVVAVGEFTGAGSVERLERWMSTFDIISSLDYVGDTLLVVTHGVLRQSPTAFVSEQDVRLDVYRMPERQKIAEDIPLPADSRVLGGGRALYILSDGPPNPWTILKARFRPVLRRG